MCRMGGRTYWVRKNLKHNGEFTINNEPIMLDFLEENDDRICWQYDKMFCFSKNKERLDSEKK